jgi:hypothetical protein
MEHNHSAASPQNGFLRAIWCCRKLASPLSWSHANKGQGKICHACQHARTVNEALGNKIREAFAGVTLDSGIGLQQAQGIDEYEDDATCASRRWLFPR